ncbi:MAG: hypothetical protein WBE26_19290 [Phycisphaerae bacterium]
MKKGARAFHILAPCHVKRKTTDDDGSETEKVVLVGFRSVPVFCYEDTDGAELPDRAADGQFADALPLVDVARAWGLKVGTYNGERARHLGYYRHGQSIALGVENLATWAHELVHAADDRCGTIVKRSGQVPSNEIVAELGGAVVLHIIGKPSDADLGGCWDYVQRFNAKHPITACQRLLKRTCAAVALILDTADELRVGRTGVTVHLRSSESTQSLRRLCPRRRRSPVLPPVCQRVTPIHGPRREPRGFHGP